MRDLDRQLARDFLAVERALILIAESSDERLAKTKLILEKEIYSDREDLRTKLEEILTGNSLRRGIGAVFLLAGILLTTVGSVLA